MTERPYTDDDLRVEAGRQHQLHIAHSNPRLLLGRMLDGPIESTRRGDDVLTWDEALNCDEFDESKNAIADLIRGAADTSRWAIDLGADGLVPFTEHAITLNAGRPIARIHFAFEPEMPEEMRDHLVAGLGEAINQELDQDADDVEDQDDGEGSESDSEVLDLISEIASRLRDATDSGEYHAVGLVYDLSKGRTTVAEARAELADIEFGHV